MASSVLVDFMRANSAVAAGDMTGAVNAMRAAVSKIDWNKQRPVFQGLGWQIFTHEALSYGAVFVDAASQRIIISRGTWQTLGHYHPAIAEFIDDMAGGASGMKFLTMDAGKYAEAARLQRIYQGDDVVLGKDAITDLADRLNRLVSQASSMQGHDISEATLGAFFLEITKAQEDYTVLQERLDHLEAQLVTVTTLLSGLE